MKFSLFYTLTFFFAFSYGIKAALLSQGQSINEKKVAKKLLIYINDVFKKPRKSLVKAHDDLNEKNFEHCRKLEKLLCESYIKATIDVNS